MTNINHGDADMTIYSYPTKEEATKAAIEMFGALAVEMDVVSVFKIGPTVAAAMGVAEGYGFEESN